MSFVRLFGVGQSCYYPYLMTPSAIISIKTVIILSLMKTIMVDPINNFSY